MIEPRTNRIIGKSESFSFQKGSPEARMQLEEHCEKLNAIDHHREWFVTRKDENRLTIDNRPRRAHREEPRCTPSEARVILRQYGLHGSAFAKAVIASLGEYSDERAAA